MRNTHLLQKNNGFKHCRHQRLLPQLEEVDAAREAVELFDADGELVLPKRDTIAIMADGVTNG